jgi:hypothetical protein
VAKDIGQDPEYVISATHGKRAVDNLSMFKPSIQSHEMDSEVQAFEETILFFADAYHLHGPGSQPGSPATPAMPLSYVPPPTDSASTTPDLSPTSSASSSPAPSFVASRPSSLPNQLTDMLSKSTDPGIDTYGMTLEGQIKDSEIAEHRLAAWQLDAAGVDRSVRILPGVQNMMSSLPHGKYAVATSGAKTYGSFFFPDILIIFIYAIPFSSRLHDARRHYTSKGHYHR